MNEHGKHSERCEKKHGQIVCDCPDEVRLTTDIPPEYRNARAILKQLPTCHDCGQAIYF